MTFGASVFALAVAAGTGTWVSAAPGPVPITAALSAAKAPVSQLVQTRTIHYGGATIARYQQVVGGVPVLGGEVTAIQAGGAPRIMADATSSAGLARAAASKAPSVSAARAIAAATAATGARALRTRPTARLFIDPKHGGALVRRVVLASGKPLKDFEVLLDATTGHVLSTRNLLEYAHGRAKVYTPNPVVESGGYSGIGKKRTADKHDKDTAKLTALRNPVTLRHLKRGQDCLVGRYVKAKLGSYNGSPVCRKSRNWSDVTRSKNSFEALNAYYNIDRLRSYLHGIGYRGSTSVHPGRVSIIADAFREDNSYYSPGDGKIRYGSGGVDDAEDGDVVVHEYGHAIQDAQDPGFGSDLQAGSLGEGFGDFMASVNTTQVDAARIPPSYLARAEACVFDWDGIGGYGGPGVAPCGRVSDGSDGVSTFHPAIDENGPCDFQRGLPGGIDIHCVGEVWTRGLNDLMGSLPLANGVPPIVFDVFDSQFGYVDSETFAQAVDGLLAADDVRFGTGAPGSGPHDAAICAEMKTARGISGTSCP